MLRHRRPGHRAAAVTSRSSSTSARRSTASFNGLARVARHLARAARRRLRGAARADQRRHRGRLQGHPPGRVVDQGRRRPLGPAVEGPQRDPRRGLGPGPARGLRGRDDRRRRPRLPRGAPGRRHQRRHRRQRHPRPVHRHGQLPLRPGQEHRGRPSRHVRQVFEGFDVHARATPPTAPVRACTCPRPRRSSTPSASPVNPKEGWTDVARFSRARHPGRQLRARRPQPRPHGRRALPRRAVRRRRARPAALAR